MAFVSFDAPVGPDDLVVGRQPPPGRHLADLILRGAQAAGFAVVESIAQHDSYGWAFTVRAGARPVWCVLQLSDEWLLITHPRVSWLERLVGGGRTAADHATLDAALVDTLSAMPSVSNVRWFRSEADVRERRASQPG
jgi:hypothetical protein